MDKMLKVFEDARIKANKEHSLTLLKIRKSNEVGKKILPFLPKGWELSFWPNSLMISNPGVGNFSVFEFRNVCNIVEKIIGERLRRRSVTTMDTDDTERLSFLEGKAFLRVGGTDENDLSLFMAIDVTLWTPDGRSTECEIEYEEKVIKIAKVDPGCLGHSEFDKKENLEK